MPAVKRPNMPRETQWTDARKLWLRQLWDEGDSTGLIAEKLDTTKSAVCGERRRLKLPERGSPLHNGPTAWHKGGAMGLKRRGPHMVPTSTLPVLPSLQTLEEPPSC